MPPGDVLKKQLIAVVDERTTVICLTTAGQIRREDEPYETPAGLFHEPPFHVHCRSYSVPWMPGMDSPEIDEARSEVARRGEDRMERQLASARRIPKADVDDVPDLPEFSRIEVSMGMNSMKAGKAVDPALREAIETGGYRLKASALDEASDLAGVQARMMERARQQGLMREAAAESVDDMVRQAPGVVADADHARRTESVLDALDEADAAPSARTIGSLEEGDQYVFQRAQEIELSQYERDALETYLNPEYETINKTVRGRDPVTSNVQIQWGADEDARRSVAEAVKALDSLAEKQALTEPMTLFRSAHGWPAKFDMDGLVGTVVDEGHYLSTSLSREFAEKWAGGLNSNKALIEIVAEEGTQGFMPTSGLAQEFGRVVDAQAEFTLARGTRLEIVSVEQIEVGGKTSWLVRAIARQDWT